MKYLVKKNPQRTLSTIKAVLPSVKQEFQTVLASEPFKSVVGL